MAQKREQDLAQALWLSSSFTMSSSVRAGILFAVVALADELRQRHILARSSVAISRRNQLVGDAYQGSSSGNCEQLDLELLCCASYTSRHRAFGMEILFDLDGIQHHIRSRMFSLVFLWALPLTLCAR